VFSARRRSSDNYDAESPVGSRQLFDQSLVQRKLQIRIAELHQAVRLGGAMEEVTYDGLYTSVPYDAAAAEQGF